MRGKRKKKKTLSKRRWQWIEGIIFTNYKITNLKNLAGVFIASSLLQCFSVYSSVQSNFKALLSSIILKGVPSFKPIVYKTKITCDLVSRVSRGSGTLLVVSPLRSHKPRLIFFGYRVYLERKQTFCLSSIALNSVQVWATARFASRSSLALL